MYVCVCVCVCVCKCVYVPVRHSGLSCILYTCVGVKLCVGVYGCV